MRTDGDHDIGGPADRLREVTLVMTDVVGSTRRWERDPDGTSILLAAHDRAIADVVHRHRGQLIRAKGEGDSTFSVFGDPVDAVTAAADIQRELSENIPVRIAVHTGSVELRDGQFFGTTPNRAARIRSVAHGGQIVVSSSTSELIADRLADGLGMRALGERRLKGLSIPERVSQLTGPGLPDDFPPLRWIDPRRSNLPLPSSSFVGRDDDTARVVELLHRTALATLVGPGGTGKTRLAIEAAFDAAEDFEGGVWFVDLSEERHPDALAGRVLDAAGLTSAAGADPVATLAHHLGGREALVVLDNCEHLLSDSAALAVRLTATGIRVVATSRAPLHVEGEATFEVRPLGLGAPTDDPAQADAVRLFLDRARASGASFEADTDALRFIRDICQRIDGLPLAIELAAARCRLMGLAELSDRLDRVFATIAGPRSAKARHRTLEALIDWSYALLEADERTLFTRLSIFRGAFDLADAESVCPDPPNGRPIGGDPPIRRPIGGDPVLAADRVLTALAELVHHHLVVVDTSSGAGRYRLLETLRLYAAEHLDDVDPIADRHLQHFLAMARTADSLPPAEQSAAVERLAAHRADLSAAIDHAIATEQVDHALELGACLWRFWFARGSDEGADHLNQILALDGGDIELRAKALIGTGVIDTNIERSWDAARRAMQLAEQMGMPELIGDAYMVQSNLLLGEDPEQAIELAERAIEWHVQGSDRRSERISRMTLALAASALARPNAIAELRSVLEDAEAAGDDYVIAMAGYQLAQRSTSGDTEELAVRARAAADRLGLRWLTAGTTLMQGLAIARAGDMDRARILFARSAAEAEDERSTVAWRDPAEFLYDAACQIYELDPETCAEFVGRAGELDPPHPTRWWIDGLRAVLARDAGRLHEAVQIARGAMEGAIEHMPDRYSRGRALVGLRCLASLAALAGDNELADRWFASVETITREVGMGNEDEAFRRRDEAIVRGDRSPEHFEQELDSLGVDPWTIVGEVTSWLEVNPFEPDD